MVESMAAETAEMWVGLKECRLVEATVGEKVDTSAVVLVAALAVTKAAT